MQLLAFACKDDAASKVNQDIANMAAERDMAALDLPKITFDKEEHDLVLSQTEQRLKLHLLTPTLETHR